MREGAVGEGEEEGMGGVLMRKVLVLCRQGDGSTTTAMSTGLGKLCRWRGGDPGASNAIYYSAVHDEPDIGEAAHGKHGACPPALSGSDEVRLDDEERNGGGDVEDKVG